MVASHKQQSSEPKYDANATTDDTKDQDVALAVVGEQSHAIDPAVEARVIAKIDRFMIPAMIVGYGFVYYDKVGNVLVEAPHES